MEVDEWLVAFAPFEVRHLLERQMALHRADPAALGEDDGDRLLLDHCRPVDLARRCNFLEPRPAIVTEFVLQRSKVPFKPRALPPWTFDQLRQLLALFG